MILTEGVVGHCLLAEYSERKTIGPSCGSWSPIILTEGGGGHWMFTHRMKTWGPPWGRRSPMILTEGVVTGC